MQGARGGQLQSVSLDSNTLTLTTTLTRGKAVLTLISQNRTSQAKHVWYGNKEKVYVGKAQLARVSAAPFCRLIPSPGPPSGHKFEMR